MKIARATLDNAEELSQGNEFLENEIRKLVQNKDIYGFHVVWVRCNGGWFQYMLVDKGLADDPYLIKKMREKSTWTKRFGSQSAG